MLFSKHNIKKCQIGLAINKRILRRSCADVSHAANLLLPLVLVQVGGAEVAPPLEQHRIANQLEPGSEFEARLGEHPLQFLGADIFRIADFVRVHVQIDICLNEEDIID